ncbi:unnamed protein product [Boreogadus saida]
MERSCGGTAVTSNQGQFPSPSQQRTGTDTHSDGATMSETVPVSQSVATPTTPLPGQTVTRSGRVCKQIDRLDLRLNRDKEEKGIVAGQRIGTSASGGGPSAGLKRETFAANDPFLLHVVVHVLEGVKAKVPSPQFILKLG